jgi:acyl-CoA thioesterase-1
VLLAPRRRLAVLGLLLVAVVVGVLAVQSGGTASARGQAWVAERCQEFRTGSAQRASVVVGSGERVVVIGDSWSAGLGLTRSAGSWPSRLPGRVSVAGFSGSGFSEGASPCGRVSFADRAGAALRRGADLVVVQGGLNDVDQPQAAVVAGFDRLARALSGHRVVVVGPAAAPSRARGAVRVDALLARLAAEHDMAYISTDDLRLPYLRDRLHLSPSGHRAYGDAVATRLAALRD